MSIYNNVPPGLMEDGRVKQSMFDKRPHVQMMKVTDPNASDYGDWVPVPGQLGLEDRFPEGWDRQAKEQAQAQAQAQGQAPAPQGPVLRARQELFGRQPYGMPAPWTNMNPQTQGQHIDQRHFTGTL